MATALSTDRPELLSRKTSVLNNPLHLALLLTVVLSAAWLMRDLAELLLGRLPDNDDMMRIAEVRDWIGGQRFNDLLQHRLGPDGGASMHWSRIADAGPALLLLVLTPLLGQQAASFVMIVAYPAILFFLYLLLVGRIAERLLGAAGIFTAIVLAALAFPTVSLFVPGRIDHHGLQIVLVFVVIDALVQRPGLGAGLQAGLAIALSLTIGLEAAPEIVAALSAFFLLWAWRGREEDRRIGGLALALGSVTLLLLTFARPDIWPELWCDGFTPASSRGTLIAAACLGALWAIGSRTEARQLRILGGALVGAAGLFFTFRTASICFSGPYASLDPFLQRVWMANVGEAGHLFAQASPGTSVAFGGLCIAGLLASLYAFVRWPQTRRNWAGFTVFFVLSVFAAILQIRVTYIVAGAAVLPFAAIIGALRDHKRGGAALAGLIAAWIAGTGFIYNSLGVAVHALTAPDPVLERVYRCTEGESFVQIARLDRGRIIAPLDAGAYLIGMTPHDVVAAPYHRNNSGNLAMYEFFFSHPDRARKIADAWQADYVAWCPSSFKEVSIEAEAPNSLAKNLMLDRTPEWLEPIAMTGDLRVYRIKTGPSRM